MPVYKDKKRGSWYYQISYTDIHGNYRQKRAGGFSTKKEAQNQEYLAGLELDRNPETDILFEDLYHHYFGYIESRIKYQSYYSKIKLADIHILPYFEGKRVNKITSKDVLRWQDELRKKGFSYEYLSKIYNNLNAIIGHGVKFYDVSTNPLKVVGNFVKKKDEIEKDIKYWTFEQFKVYEGVMSEENSKDAIMWKTFFMFSYYNGNRKGEGRALSWKDINWVTNEVSITKTATEKLVNKQFKITPPKTTASIRRVLMPDSIVKQLKLYYEYCKRMDGFNDSWFVFGMHRPLAPTTIQRHFEKYWVQTELPKITIHDLRHSHASLLINLGANILVVSQRLGHSDINETLNTYSHMFPSSQKEVVDLINNL